ncbi:MAG: M15 family metallopeptidase [Acidimicrobiales bacterium]
MPRPAPYRLALPALLAAVTAGVWLLALSTPAGAAPPLCDRVTPTIVGTAGDDWLLGTSGDDVILGLGGDDHINGRGGDDLICGGGGRDELAGGRGDDMLDGAGGDDDLHGAGGRDMLTGGPGDDELNGGFGVDSVWGNGGHDRCWGENPRCEHKVRTRHRTPAGPKLVFTWKVRGIDESNQGRVAATWRPECPVALADLRLVTVGHSHESGRSLTGELVIHRDHTDDLVRVFGTLFDHQFPIHRLDVVDVFNGDDQASMRANNTSAFNCREVDGSPGVWSQHAYGRAVDINPLVNPWVRGSQVDPPEGAAYVVRDPSVPGLIVAGDIATSSFAAAGWAWGGNWTSSKDYQHFSANGR